MVLGSGFSSLSAACYLAKDGHKVTLIEKNPSYGGRARQLKKQGFTFDMGPTFYWMPDVFDSFFKDFGVHTSDFYQLKKLNPAYQIYFGEKKSISIPDTLEETCRLFENIEPGSGIKLENFISRAKQNYHLAIDNLVYNPGENLGEIITWETIQKLGLFVSTIRSQVHRDFTNPWLRTTLEFPILFLGSTPAHTPAFYNFMNYADLGLGTWYPEGGMYSVVEAMVKLADSLGVKLLNSTEATHLEIHDKKVISVKTNQGKISSDLVVSGADYAHTEKLLPPAHRQYSEKYWSTRKFAPSALMYYVGFDKKLTGVSHHTLFFDTNFETHAESIYQTKEWPEEPLFYASFPSLSDSSVAPENHEAGIFLIPIAPGISDPESIRNQYFEKIMNRLEKVTGQSLSSHILFWESYSVSDFEKDYHAYQGNAYGLANTLLQTHILRPKMRSRKLKNLFFTGQLTVPGPGVPPSIISGKIVSQLISKEYERTF
ncbi:MAG: phytoene desaturase [Saprospiraceae bacterium]|nr:phytoene desaturase [Saprospiraceae bacterium]